LRSVDGGWADYARSREEEAAAAAAAVAAAEQPREPKAKKAKAHPERPPQRRQTELERVEAAIAGRETEIAELERRLATDWGDVDLLAAHRAARDDLAALLARWERLFEASQA
jgi:hypothetical protein